MAQVGNNPGLGFRLRWVLSPGRTRRIKMFQGLSYIDKAQEIIRLCRHQNAAKKIRKLLEDYPEVFGDLGSQLTLVVIALVENGLEHTMIRIGTHSGAGWPGSGKNEVRLAPFYQELFPESTGPKAKYDRSLIGWGAYLECEEKGYPVKTTIREIFRRLLEKQGVAIDKLIECLDHRDAKVREFFIAVLGELGDERSLQPLQRILDGPDEGRIDREYFVKKGTIIALAKICDRDTTRIAPREKNKIIDVLMNILRRQVESQDKFRWPLTETTIYALGQLGDKRDETLMNLLGDILMLRLRLDSADVYHSNGKTAEKKAAAAVLAQFGAAGSARAMVILNYIAEKLSPSEGYSTEEFQQSEGKIRTVNGGAKELARRALDKVRAGPMNGRLDPPYR
jgi:hypothetical protein